jgi:hypothetical protein
VKACGGLLDVTLTLLSLFTSSRKTGPRSIPEMQMQEAKIQDPDKREKKEKVQNFLDLLQTSIPQKGFGGQCCLVQRQEDHGGASPEIKCCVAIFSLT